MYQVVLFRLRRNDLVQGTILVEQQVRISIAQHSRTFRRQHEELVASVWHEERSTFVIPSI